MTSKKFVESLAKIPSMPGDRERQVEQTYNDILKTDFPGITISNPYKCDGYFEFTMDYDATHNGRVLIEYKYDRDMSNAIERAKVIIQPIFYLKRFENAGKILPNIIVIADVNEVFVLHSNCLLKYLDEEGIDWTIAPSGAAAAYPDLVAKIAMDTDIKPFVRNVTDPGFDFKEVTEQIKNQNATVPRKSRITEHNIGGLFEHFEKKVLSKKSAGALSTKDKVSVFIGCLIDPDNHYLHPKKMNLLCTPKGELMVSSTEFNAFFANYTDQYSPVEKKKFTEIADRLIEDTDRRKSGDFWTPTNFVDYAHGRIEKVFGENWKDEYVVWDCCCGTKNLTRDYRFKELYCSTLFQSELDMAERYNPEAVSFQFDFLNDDFEKLPEGLKEAFRNKKILFLMNPPYARNGGEGIGAGTTSSVAFTKMNELMKADKFGACSANILAQFLYRCEKLKKDFGVDVSLAFFCNPIYLSGSTYGKFRDKFLKDFKYEDGFLFNAGHFSDVSAAWGIDFTIWTSGETFDKNNFKHDLVDTDENGEIVKIGEKDIYNIDGSTPANMWMKEKTTDKVDFPNMKGAVSIVEDGNKTVAKGFIGTMLNGVNPVSGNGQSVALFSGCAKKGGNQVYSILPSNFLRCTCAFTARKLIESNWINQKDEYLAPDTSNPNFHQFEMDSVIYSLFHSSSQQSSLRQIDYNGKKWDIKNEFFWMSKSDISDLANENNNDDAYNDARMSEDRFVYKFIQSHLNEFSPEAKAVLDKACDLVRKSFKFRVLFSQDHEEYQLGNWDCGYYQLKPIWKDFLKKDFDEFKGLYKSLSEKLRPRVYELGFLKK